MCGIVGMAGVIEHKHKEAFKDMLTVCQVRGRDSTGVIRVRSTNHVDWEKMVGTPEYLLDSKRYDKNIDTGLSKVLVGHCRAKTSGVVSNKNAHPFEHGNFIGVHNGTLRNCFSLEGFRDFDVDSDWLYWHMDRYGVEETIAKIEGAWALVWWNQDDNSINFLKNDERPLVFSWTKDKKVMLWASEPWMIQVFARKSGNELWDGEETGKVFHSLANNEWWSYQINRDAKGEEKVFKLSFPVKEVKPEVRSYAGNYRGNYHGGSRGTYSPYTHPASVVNHNNHIPEGWERKNGILVRKEESAGGEVTNPFHRANLDDKLEDIGRKPQGTNLPATTNLREGLETFLSKGEKSSTSSGSVVDFRPVSLAGKKSEREILSLPSKSSSTSTQASKNKPSSVSVLPKSAWKDKFLGRKVSLRSVLGTEYITDCKTGAEYTAKEFEERTNAICTFCKSPVGDLKEVAEFYSEGTRFVCTSCIEDTSPIGYEGKEVICNVG